MVCLCFLAMVGWDSHGGWSHPVFDGYIVCEEHVEMLMDAWQVGCYCFISSCQQLFNGFFFVGFE